MKGMRQGWLESKLAAAEAEVNSKASAEFNGRVPPECTATIAGAAAGALEAIESIPVLDKLWGTRGDEKKAMGAVRVFTLHLLSTWLASAPELPQPADSPIARKDWAQHMLSIFGMESEQNLNQFQMRDVQTAFDQTAKGTHLVSTYLLISDLMRALGDATKGPLVQAKSVPLDRFDDLIVSPAFRDRVSSIDITTIREISTRSHQTCSEVYRELGGREASERSPLPATDAEVATLSEPEEALDDEEGPDEEAISEEAISEEAAAVEPAVEEQTAEAAREAESAKADEDVLDAALLDEAAETVAAFAGASAASTSSSASASGAAAASAEQAPGPAAPEGPQGAAAPQQPADADRFEFDGEIEVLTFAEDGVGIVSVYDEAAPVWRELGFARGELMSPKGLPLRVAVNLSLRTAVEAMDEGPRRQFERMDDSQINRAAAAALVPLEHQFLRPLACPRCGNRDHLNLLQQEALAGEYHPDIASWPYSAPGGDRYTLGCPSCDFLFEVVFWFYE